MVSRTPRQSPRLALNQTVFHVAQVFLMTGILSNFMQNLFRAWPLDYVLNGLAMLVLLLMLWLNRRHRIEPGPALIISFSVTVLVFSLGDLLASFLLPGNPFAWIANPQIPLILSLFGAVCGLAVDRRAVVWFGGICILVEIWFSFSFHNSAYYREQLPLNVFVITGTMVMVWFYRGRLETLVGQLDHNLEMVTKLKDQAEQLNEQNKPFVVFGRNTAGLIQDFSLEVQQLSRGLGELRQSSDPKEQADLLAGMSSTMEMLNHRIEWVKYIASASPQRQEEELDLRKLVDSAVYSFHILPEFRTSVEFRIDVQPGVVVFGHRRWLLRAIELLVGAGCHDGATRIELEINIGEASGGEGGVVLLTYRDNGLADASSGQAGSQDTRQKVEEAVREFCGKLLSHRSAPQGTIVVMELGKRLNPGVHS